MRDELQKDFGNIDIYLFDQLLKGRFDHCERILDTGCGMGRNLVYFLRNNFQVYGIDQDPDCIEQVKQLSAVLAPALPPDHFRVSLVEKMPFRTSFFDVVISSAVLHFARDANHFDEMLKETWRVLRPGGYLFARLASMSGPDYTGLALGNGRYQLPDGTTRFLVSDDLLLLYTQALDGTLFEHLKTTHVHRLRSMTTWCIQKN